MEGASGGSVKIEDGGGDQHYYPDYITLLVPVVIIYVVTALLLFLFRILRCYQVRNSTAWSWTGFASSSILLLQLWLSILILSPLLLLGLLLLVSAKGLVSLILRVRHGTWEEARLAGGNDAIWGYEGHGSNSIITAIYIVQGNCDVTKIRDYFQERILCCRLDGDDGGRLVFQKFMWRLKTLWGFFYWEKFPDFNINQHVRTFSSSPVQLAQTHTEESVFQELSRIADDTFDFTRPPWEILVFPKYEYDEDDTHEITTIGKEAGTETGTGTRGTGDKYYAILFRIHHSLIDGVSAGIALNYFLIDKPVSLSIDPFKAPSVSVVKLVGFKLMALFLSPLILARSLMTNRPNPLHGPKITGPKIFRWSKPISMDVVKRIKNSSKTSVTSVLITAVGGGIFESLSSTSSNNGSNNSVKKKIQVPDCINVATAVAILPYKRTPVNQFSILMLPLPLTPFKTAASSPSPPLPAPAPAPAGKEAEEGGKPIFEDELLQVLRYVYAWSETAYSASSVLANFYAMKIIGSLPKVLVRLLAGKTDATVSCSNVPGPASFTHVFGGDLVLDIAFWAPMKNKVALGVNFFSYAGKLRTAIVGDSCVFDSPKQVEDLVHSIENQMCSLYKIVEFESLDIIIP